MTKMKQKQNVVVHYIEPTDDQVATVAIYGDPEGLRALAQALIEVASYDQSKKLVQTEGEYWKIRSTPRGNTSFLVLHDLSLPLNVGRLDCARDGSFEWFLGPVEARRASSSEIKMIEEMEQSDAPKSPTGRQFKS